MFIAMSEDMRVILVKLADRLHNMRTLDHHPDPGKRERIALETLHIYAPIADRLGIFDLKEMLESECFRILHPDDYKKIFTELAGLRHEQETFVATISDRIKENIPENIPVLDVSFRVKSPYSIYKKMVRKGYDRVASLYDLFALRIITDSVTHCYEILGIMHSAWTPIPNRFKDYIALPKENGYQSLHTTVVGMLKEFRQQPTEIQIRTMDMHLQAEIGVAAHFAYSETGRAKIAKDAYWVSELKEILENSEDYNLMDDMRLNVFGDRIFVFTPRGSVINLPRGSTPIDFAYTIHSDLGNHIAFARVNDRVVPLDRELANGDRVEIISDKNKRPSITWLSFVKTSRAREVIKSTINKEQREMLIERGRFMLNAYLEKNFGKGLDKEMSLLKNLDGRILDTKAKEDVLVQIGNLSRKPASVVRAMREAAGLLSNTHKKPTEAEANSRKIATPSLDNAPELIIGGEYRIPYHTANCCSPQHGDRVVGYVNRNGITIHKVECSSLKKGVFERFIPAYWSDQEPQTMRIRTELTFLNKFGVLRKISDIFFLMHLNVLEMHQTMESDGKTAKMVLLMETKEEDYYLHDRLIDRFRMEIPEFKSGKLIEMK